MPLTRKQSRIVLQSDAAAEDLSARTLDVLLPTEIGIVPIDPLGDEELLLVYTDSIRHTAEINGYVPESFNPTLQQVIDGASTAWLAHIRTGASHFQILEVFTNRLAIVSVDEIWRMNGEAGGVGQRWSGYYHPGGMDAASSVVVREEPYAFLYLRADSTATAITIQLDDGTDVFDVDFSIARRPFVGVTQFIDGINTPATGSPDSFEVSAKTPANAANSEIKFGLAYPMEMRG